MVHCKIGLMVYLRLANGLSKEQFRSANKETKDCLKDGPQINLLNLLKLKAVSTRTKSELIQILLVNRTLHSPPKT